MWSGRITICLNIHLNVEKGFLLSFHCFKRSSSDRLKCAEQSSFFSRSSSSIPFRVSGYWSFVEPCCCCCQTKRFCFPCEQKYFCIIWTKKGELFCDYNFAHFTLITTFLCTTLKFLLINGWSITKNPLSTFNC